MKKIVMFMAAATTLAMASCSNDQELSLNQGEAISFRTAFGMPTSRALLDVTEVGDMRVTAMLGTETYFENVLFKKEGENNSYSSDTKYYWPGDNRALSFTAVPKDQTEFIKANYSPAANWGQQEDLIYCFGSTGTASQAAGAGVRLDFYHVLSQVEIMARNTNPVYEIKVVNAKIGNVNSAGMFVQGANLDASSWSFGENPATTSYTSGTAGTDLTDENAIELVGDKNADFKSVMIAGGNAMVLPQKLNPWNKKSFANGGGGAGSYLALKVSIKTKLGENRIGARVYPKADSAEKYAWVAVPIATEWKCGKKYTYQLTFGEGAGTSDPEKEDPKPILNGEIKVSTVVNGWVDGTIENPKPELKSRR